MTKQFVHTLDMPDYLGDDQRKIKEEEKDDSPIRGISKIIYFKPFDIISRKEASISASNIANVSLAR